MAVFLFIVFLVEDLEGIAAVNENGPADAGFRAGQQARGYRSLVRAY